MKISFHEGQAKIFLEDVKKYNVIVKGRRFGLTYGYAQDLVLRLVTRPDNVKFLWGDTITGNIIRYYRQYIAPKLREAYDEGLIVSYNFNEMYKMLTVKLPSGIEKQVDFRSADRPQNWEGFGYDVVYLNEAGIILKNAYLWDNAVAPMLLDNPKSIAFIGGAPKGYNRFCELAEKANKDKTGKWRLLRFSSYDNPLLDPVEIKALEEQLPPEVARAEIYGECINTTADYFFPYELVEKCLFETPFIVESQEPITWGLDVARHGSDNSVLAIRYGRNIVGIQKLKHNDDLATLAEIVAAEYQAAIRKPVRIFVDVTGMGWGVYDVLKRLLPSHIVVGVNFADKNIPNRLLENRRAYIYFNLRTAMFEGLSFAEVPEQTRKELVKEFWATEKEYTKQGKIKLIDKEKIREKIGRSPDMLDAVALCFSESVPLEIETKLQYHNNYEEEGVL